MNTNRYTPEKVVAENLNFNIPLYQRLFAWGKKEVEGLLSDLKDHFKEMPEGSPYYLGMLSCIRRGNSYDLIDGQQRFTVIMLMGIVLRKYDERWKEFIGEDNRLDFTGRSKDRDYLISKIKNETSYNRNEKMDDAIEEIESFMEREFQDEDEKGKFASQVYERLSFFFSVLPDEYMNDPTSLNKYFESMNSTGKGLEQHEILKVQLLKGQENQEWLTRLWNAVSEMSHTVIKRADQDQESYCKKYREAIKMCQSDKYEEALNLCESSFDATDNISIGDIMPEQRKGNGQDGNEKERQTVVTFPEFLLMILDITTEPDDVGRFYRTQLLDAVKKHPIADVPSFYNTMLHYRLLLDYYVISWESDTAGNRYDLINDSGEKSEHVKQYESMLYVSQTPFYKWLKPLLMKLAASDEIADNEHVLAMLKKIDGSQRELPASMEELSYDKKPDRYWFWRLDYYLWEKAKGKENDYFTEKQKEIVRDYVFRANRSLEHLHPQHQAYNEEWEEVDSFGNLAMISQSFNSQQSDDPVNVKFARIAEQAKNHSLQSIKLYKMYLDANCTPGGWTKETMENHGKEMYRILQESMPTK